jgi:hypothetical protein
LWLIRGATQLVALSATYGVALGGLPQVIDLLGKRKI